MSSYETNLYYNPAESGLEVAHLIERDESYSFDMLVVWRRLSDGALFWATDSGCSCPSPFEDYNSIEDLTPLTAESYDDFRVEATAYSDSVAPLVIDTMLHEVAHTLDIFPGVAA